MRFRDGDGGISPSRAKGAGHQTDYEGSDHENQRGEREYGADHERGIKLYPLQAPEQVEMSVPVNGGNRLVQARSIAILCSRSEAACASAAAARAA